MNEDQRQVHNRPDVLSWETEPSPRTSPSQVISGPVVRLDHRTDADWVVC
jgi:hypothetical protein